MIRRLAVVLATIALMMVGLVPAAPAQHSLQAAPRREFAGKSYHPASAPGQGVRQSGSEIRDPRSATAKPSLRGGTGIRTQGTGSPVQQFSRLPPSSARPSLPEWTG